jgi:hypothetical protein
MTDEITSRVPVILESPYAGDRATNDEYLIRAMRDSISRGEAPFASHRMYPGVLDDDISDQRKIGIECGLAWAQLYIVNNYTSIGTPSNWAKLKAVIYIDYGITDGMALGINHHSKFGTKIECRKIGKNPT